MKYTKICIVCKKEFSRPKRRDFNRWEKQLFCSSKCRAPHNSPFKKGNKLNLGRKCTEETKRKIGLANSGANCHWWKGGICRSNRDLRRSRAYRNWQVSVYKRDDYTCQICGSKSRNLNANHIKTFSQYPDLRFNLDNGITLCRNCHVTLVNYHEKEWESYFNFNLLLRGGN